MGTTFLLALALMLILEGVLPFLAPNLWRDTFRRITQMSDGQIRFVGLSSMLIGLLILYAKTLLQWAAGSCPSKSTTAFAPKRCASSGCVARSWTCSSAVNTSS